MINSISGKKIISEIPLDRLLLESDGPFIKFREELFVPSHNIHIVIGLSEILNISQEKTLNILHSNFKCILQKP